MQQARNLNSVKGIKHGFFGRQGGVSSGIFDSLNCGLGSGDELSAVNANRVRVAEQVSPGGKLLTLRQVHSPRVVEVRHAWEGAGPEGDAMVTAEPGVILGILTADCAPVLFADEEAGVIGAAHAGWKGALTGVAEATIAAMERLGARREALRAAIGPCISQSNYEVGPEFAETVRAADAGNARFFQPSTKPGHFMFDLEGYVASRLTGAGLSDIARLSACTYAGTADFFSFRRTTHRKESAYGRQISTIALTA